jgi:hypothetical protein
MEGAFHDHRLGGVDGLVADGDKFAALVAGLAHGADVLQRRCDRLLDIHVYPRP